MITKKRSVVGNALALQASRFSVSALALGSGILIGRTLGAAGFGEYGLLLAVAVVIQSVVSLGLEDFCLAWLPKTGVTDSRAVSWISIVLFVRVAVCLSLISFAAVFLSWPDLLPGTTSSVGLALAMAYAGLNGVATLGAVVLATQGRATYSAYLDGIWALLVVVGQILLASVDRLTVETAVGAVAAAQFLVSCVYVVLWLPARRDGGPTFIFGNKSLLRASGISPVFSLSRVRTVSQFWLNGLLNLGAGKNSDVLVLGICGASAYELGLYNAAFAIFILGSFLPMQGIGTILYVQLGEVFGTSSSEKIADAWRVTVIVSMMVLIPCLSFTAFFGGQILSALYGSEFASAQGPLIVLVCFSMVSRLGGGGSNQAILFLSNKASWVLWVRVSFVLLNIVLDIIFYFSFGIIGVAVATGLSGALISFAELVICKRLHRFRVPFDFFIRFSAICLFLAAVASYLIRLTDLIPMASLIVGGAAFCAAIAAAVLVFRPVGIRDYERIASFLPETSVVMRAISRR